MVKIALLVALLYSNIGYAKKIVCPEIVPVLRPDGVLIDLLKKDDPVLKGPRARCQAGNGPVSLPCVHHIIVIDETRATVMCSPGEIAHES